MAKTKFALLKDIHSLPEISAMKKALKVKQICPSSKFSNKTTDWIEIEYKETFAIEVISDFESLFEKETGWNNKLYAFSDDANTTMLSLIYPNNILTLFEVDNLDANEYMDAHWARDTLGRFAKTYDNDAQIDFILGKLKFNKSQISKLNSFKLQDKKHYDYVMELRNTYSEKMKKILSSGWSWGN
jgi:hypothetical protein